MSGQGDEPLAAERGTISRDTDSRSAASSLSDPFVVVSADRTNPNSRPRVRAPEGSSVMEVRRSSRVAAARSRPPLLPVVEEEPAQSRPLSGPLGNTVDLWGTVNPQMGSSASRTCRVGRKRAASTAAPSSARRIPNPHLLASAADFSPGHFDEPLSDALVPPGSHDMRQRSHVPASPMRVDSTVQAVVSRPDGSPISSTISHNPLFATPVASDHPRSPRRQPSATLLMRDSNMAQAAMEGLIPISEGFQAPGYAPVGGVTYQVCSPRMGRPDSGKAGTSGSMRGRQLLSEYTSMVGVGPLDPPAAAANQHPALRALLRDVCLHSSHHFRIY